jgi:hypothetical protein
MGHVYGTSRIHIENLFFLFFSFPRVFNDDSSPWTWAAAPTSGIEALDLVLINFILWFYDLHEACKKGFEALDPLVPVWNGQDDAVTRSHAFVPPSSAWTPRVMLKSIQGVGYLYMH